MYGVAPAMAMPWFYSIIGKDTPETFVPVHKGLHHGFVGFLMMVGAFTASKLLKSTAVSLVSKIMLGVGVFMFLEDFIHEQVYRKVKSFEDTDDLKV